MPHDVRSSPCLSQISGQGTTCANLTAGTLTGTKFGGGFPAVDSQVADITTVFQFIAQ